MNHKTSRILKNLSSIALLGFACFGFLIPSQAQESPVRIAFWNVESFFDPFVDSTMIYNDFTEEGSQHWTQSRFYRKRNNVYKTILALSENRPIGILGLCEVENEYVLRSLFQYTPLKNHNYRWIHYDGPDRRGIDPAIVYSLDYFMLVESTTFPYYNPETPDYQSRDIMYAKFVAKVPEPVEGSTFMADTLHVFVNHWPSRYSGELETIGSRACAATLLRSKVDSIMTTNSEDYQPKIIIMGDFNDTPDEASIYDILRARLSSESEEDGLVNLFEETERLGFEGTIKHQADWQVFDQVIVTKSLLNDRGGLHYLEGSARIFHPDFLLTNDETHRGKKPYRTYLGPRYIGGFSDHLPVSIDLSFGCPYGQKSFENLK